MGTNCAPLHADMFLCLHMKLALFKNPYRIRKRSYPKYVYVTPSYIDDVLSLSNAQFNGFIDRIYHFRHKECYRESE
jgi:hypothetical protein